MIWFHVIRIGYIKSRNFLIYSVPIFDFQNFAKLCVLVTEKELLHSGSQYNNSRIKD